MIHTSDSWQHRSTTLSEANDLIFQERIRKTLWVILNAQSVEPKSGMFYELSHKSRIRYFLILGCFYWTSSCPCRFFIAWMIFCTIDSGHQIFFPAFTVGLFVGFLSKVCWNDVYPERIRGKEFPTNLPSAAYLWNGWLNYQLVTTDTHKHTWYELDLLGFNLACAQWWAKWATRWELSTNQ